jgi:hypothetical protein
MRAKGGRWSPILQSLRGAAVYPPHETRGTLMPDQGFTNGCFFVDTEGVVYPTECPQP